MTSNKHLTLLKLATLACGLLACGPQLDRISEVKTLRIVGVRKSAPYAKPGETVNVRMLWEDGRVPPAPQVQTFMGFWCVNPAGGSYASCLSQDSGMDPQFVFDQDNIDIVIPEDSLLPPRQANLPPGGSAYVFYGACAGTLEVDTDLTNGQGKLPRCINADGEAADADDFIIGYSQIFIYEDLRNQNPIITGLKFKGEDVSIDCLDDACQGPFVEPPLTGCVDGVICLESCKDDGDMIECSGSSLEVIVDPASAEKDEVAEIAYGSDNEESIWVSYFIDRGSLGPELKTINDSTLGWQSSPKTDIYSPQDEGPVRVWAVVRDNRGGAAWLRAPGYVKAKD